MGAFDSFLKSILGGGGEGDSSHLSPEQAQERLKAKNPPQFIDVRTKEEHHQARIAGSRLIPLHELDGRLREVDKVRPVLLYCRSGNRSGMALRILKSKGYPDVSHIRGGLLAWSRSGLPVENAGG